MRRIFYRYGFYSSYIKHTSINHCWNCFSGILKRVFSRSFFSPKAYQYFIYFLSLRLQLCVFSLYKNTGKGKGEVVTRILSILLFLSPMTSFFIRPLNSRYFTYPFSRNALWFSTSPRLILAYNLVANIQNTQRIPPRWWHCSYFV